MAGPWPTRAQRARRTKPYPGPSSGIHSLGLAYSSYWAVNISIEKKKNTIHYMKLVRKQKLQGMAAHGPLELVSVPHTKLLPTH
jgi:hypothetical protein